MQSNSNGDVEMLLVVFSEKLKIMCVPKVHRDRLFSGDGP